MNREIAMMCAVTLQALVGCTSRQPAMPTKTVRCAPAQVWGSIGAMHGGDLSTQIELSKLEWNDATVALGATTGKKMEITAVGGHLVLVGPGDGESVRDSQPKEQEATFLVYSTPSRWTDVGTVSAGETSSLLKAVAGARQRSACATDEIVPFRARGHATSVTWSTVGQPSGHTQTDTDVDVVLVGFWAPKQQGVFVPPGQDGHVHVFVPAIERGGHLRAIRFEDDLELELGEVLEQSP